MFCSQIDLNDRSLIGWSIDTMIAWHRMKWIFYEINIHGDIVILLLLLLNVQGRWLEQANITNKADISFISIPNIIFGILWTIHPHTVVELNLLPLPYRYEKYCWLFFILHKLKYFIVECNCLLKFGLNALKWLYNGLLNFRYVMSLWVDAVTGKLKRKLFHLINLLGCSFPYGAAYHSYVECSPLRLCTLMSSSLCVFECTYL